MSQSVGNTALAYARLWHVVDARNLILGRVSTQITQTLLGKHKPIYDQGVDCGDHVVVINARHIAVSGRKQQQKRYIYHTGHPGGLKVIPYERMLERKPTEIIRKAVGGMLPKNRLRKVRMARLHIFPDEEHPYIKNLVKRYDEKVPLKPVEIQD
ncbi:50S ribosomal protein L13 [Ramicandelaber brevisporus]|nr:50S ribosomal protein L13 [Ramicandelaber brevisporus]